MCGFLAQIGSVEKDSKDRFRLAFDMISHRGPDNSNIFESKNFLLGHKRLSIIDIDERSNQPFTDGKNFLLYNGEIYNFHSLKKFINEKYHYNFKTESDTEVLFIGLKLEGLNFIERIDGMYAFCFISEDNQMHLARDHFGQKPLFYGINDKHFVVGSELISLLKIFNRDVLTINSEAIEGYLQYGASIAPNTFYTEILQVIPGEAITIDLSTYKINKHNLNLLNQLDSNKTHLKESLTMRVKSCLISDTPIAFLSSGGIDSSALIKTFQLLKNKQPKIAIHLNTNEDKKGLEIAKKLETNSLRLKIIKPREIDMSNEDEIKLLLGRFGEPFADSSYFYSEALYSSIPKEYKVIVGGDGADEVFLGYRPKIYLYFSSIISSFFSRKTNMLIISYLEKFGKFGIYLSTMFGCKDSIEKILMGFNSREIKKIKNDSFSSLNNLDTKSLLRGTEIIDFYDNYLMKRLSNVFLKKSDHASMKFSKELRSPYLQGKLTEFRKMSNLIDNLIPKFRLKMYLISSLSLFSIFRKKTGFNILSENFKDIRKKQILSWCSKNKQKISSIFDYSNFLQLINSTQKDSYLYRIQILIVWLESFYDEK